MVDGAEGEGCSSAEARRERKTFYYHSQLEVDWPGVQESRSGKMTEQLVVLFSQALGL